MKKLKFWDWVSSIIFLLGAVFVNVGIINNDSFGAGLSICGVIFLRRLRLCL